MNRFRLSDWTLVILILGVLGILGSVIDSVSGVETALPALQERASLVQRLELTDLALFMEARYTRHPSQADAHAAFQDHPFAFEHFPSGSLVPPPRFVSGERP